MWFMVDVEPEGDVPRPITLPEMRAEPALEYMALLKRGQRLSVQPVTPQEWNAILALSRRPPSA
jgi:predicted RNA-binding protein with PUA-like domain